MAQNEPIWSISEVNNAVRELIENSLTPFWLQGEVGTLNIYNSGHVYLTLKDQHCQLRGTFFRGAEAARAMNLAVGMQVEAFGKLTVYPQRGDYQFNIKTLRPAGAGSLQQQFDEIKNRLAAEGLFDASRKLPLPKFPRAIGVVTSPDGAAVRDFLNIVSRRAPWITVKIYPAAVQGNNTAESVMGGIEYFNRTNNVDIIVITRGGGSMEDLWGFNNEALARMIAASRIPVISAVGHEIDFTIADFAAAVRAPTPSAAAELAAPEKSEIIQRLDHRHKQLSNALELACVRARQRCERLADSFVFRKPEYLLRHHTERLARVENSLVFRAPEQLFQPHSQHLDELTMQAAQAAQKQLEIQSRRLAVAEAKLSAMDPQAVLNRGFAILFKNDRSVADSTAKLASGEKLSARLKDGEVTVTVD